jgi:hypothetical protein
MELAYLAELDVQIERLYKEFGRYGRYAPLTADGVTDLESRILKTSPLRQLPQPILLTLPYWLLYKAGTVEDLKHYLPRLLESGVREAFGVDPQVARQLRRTEWWTWPEGEIDAIRAFMHAYWAFVLESDEAGSARDALCVLANLEDDVSAYLERWLETKSRQAWLELARLALEAAAVAQRGRTRLDLSWEGREAQWEQVAHWLAQPRVREHLELGFATTHLSLVWEACEALRALPAPPALPAEAQA